MSGQTGASLSGKWNVSFIELINCRRKFKVTRSFIGLPINETRLFDDKKEAESQFAEWMRE